jgi:hypothetical protein
MQVWLKDKTLFEHFLTSYEDVLFYHVDSDDFRNANVDEFQSEALSFTAQGLQMLAVLPRTYGETRFNLILFQHPSSRMNPCKLAFNCSRAFCGLSYLVKKNICWGCKKHTKSVCAGCHIATYCSKDCQKTHFPMHKKFCKMVRKSPPRIADASENLQMKR